MGKSRSGIPSGVPSAPTADPSTVVTISSSTSPSQVYVVASFSLNRSAISSEIQLPSLAKSSSSQTSLAPSLSLLLLDAPKCSTQSNV